MRVAFSFYITDILPAAFVHNFRGLTAKKALKCLPTSSSIGRRSNMMAKYADGLLKEFVLKSLNLSKTRRKSIGT